MANTAPEKGHKQTAFESGLRTVRCNLWTLEGVIGIWLPWSNESPDLGA